MALQDVSIMSKIALGFGSNLGNREGHILRSLSLLCQRKVIRDIAVSSLVENRAMLLPDSPSEWDIDFLNCVVVAITDLPIGDLIRETQKIEIDVGRKSSKKWAPREIDIDILVYGEEYEEGIVPHYGLLERDFAIGLLAELWPDWKYPVQGRNFQRTAKELSEEL